MIKFIVGIAIVCFTGFCGYFLAGKYRKRKAFFAQMNAFNERFLNEISYYRRPISEFAAQYPYVGDFRVVLYGFLSCLDIGRKNGENVSDIQSYYPDYFTADEKKFLSDYFGMLGRGDCSSQKAYFNAVKPTLTDYKKQAETACQKYGELYLKLGFLLGLAIVVLIV